MGEGYAHLGRARASSEGGCSSFKDVPAQALRGLLEFSPTADVRDFTEGSRGMTRGILALDP